MSNNHFSRRGFLAASSVAIGAGIGMSRNVFGANERIRLGMIGTGGRNGAHIKDLGNLRESQNVEITAVCDVWRPNRESAAAR